MSVMYAGDRDRERAAAQLREHYVRGRLTVEELNERLSRVIAARSRSELRAALAELPLLPDGDQVLAYARSAARTAVRGVALVVLTGAYLVFTFVLLVALAVTAIVASASAATLLVFLLVWLVPTYLLSRLWRGPRRERTPARSLPN